MGDHSNIPTNHEELNARDINMRETGVIFMYTVTLAAVFFASCFALYIYFRWEVDIMKEERIRTPVNAVYDNIKSNQAEALAKSKLDIEKAMQTTVQDNK